MDVKKYYDTKAAQYDAERSTGFLARCVAKEQQAIMELLAVKKGDIIFDVGCGQGFYADLIRKKGATTFGIDISPKMVEEYKKKGFQGQVVDIQTTPVSKMFDKMLCAGALEFIPELDAALRNMAKSLRKKGTFVLLCPALSFMGLLYKAYHLTHGINVHLFTEGKIRELFGKNGLSISEIRRPHGFAMVIKAVRT
jgi:SAM-dependent methyltransferase